MWIYILIAWIICAGFSAYIASQKNRSAGNWFLLGLFFGLFALITIAAVPSISKNSTNFGNSNYAGISLQVWECKNCNQINGYAIKVCSKCGMQRLK